MYRKLVIFGLVLMFIPIVNAALTDSNIAYYPFDSNASDIIGSFDFTVSGASSVSGKINNDYDFNGSSDYLYNTAVDGVNHGSDFTFSLWVTRDDTNAVARAIITNRNNDGLWNVGQYLDSSTNDITFRIFDETNDVYEYVYFGITNSAYHHIVGVFNSSGIFAYKNGTLVDSNLGSYTFRTSLTGGMFIGRNSATNWYWDGNIDELSFWSRTLSPSEITTLYNSGSGLQYPYTSGDDCDYSGSGNWVIDESCHIDTDSNLETGKTLFVTAGNTVWVDAGVTVN